MVRTAPAIHVVVVIHLVRVVAVALVPRQLKVTVLAPGLMAVIAVLALVVAVNVLLALQLIAKVHVFQMVFIPIGKAIPSVMMAATYQQITVTIQATTAPIVQLALRSS
jgi:hypothetical protein